MSDRQLLVPSAPLWPTLGVNDFSENLCDNSRIVTTCYPETEIYANMWDL